MNTSPWRIALCIATIPVLATATAGSLFAESGERILRAIEKDNTIVVLRDGEETPLVVQNAPEGHRPYLHPIMAPDGNGALTSMGSEEDPHQTGLY